MPDVGQNGVQVRCPNCRHVLTLSAEAATQAVECPSCRHPTVGKKTVSDDARTHLILDPIWLVDDDAGAEPSAAAAAPAAAAPAAAAPAAAAPAAKTTDTPRTTAGPPGDARTQLMLGPLILKDGPIPVLAASAQRPSWFGQQTRRLGSWVDERLHDRWSAALAAAALAGGIGAPLIDQRGEAPGAAISVLASLALFIGLAAFGVVWLSKLRNLDGDEDLWAAGARLRGAARRLVLDVQAFEHSSPYIKLFVSGQGLALVGLAGLSGASAGTLIRFASGLNEPYGVVRVSSGILLLLGLSSMVFAARWPVVPPAPEELGESIAAAKKLAAFVDLSESLPPSFIDGHTHLHRILIALAQWRETPWPDSAGYRAALERHFQRHLPASRIEREKWLGRTRASGIADLVIDDMVVLQVTRGFQPTTATRAIAQLSDVAQTWQTKPMILVIFEGRHEAIFQSARTSSLVELHERFPLLTVRMPAES